MSEQTPRRDCPQQTLLVGPAPPTPNRPARDSPAPSARKVVATRLNIPPLNCTLR